MTNQHKYDIIKGRAFFARFLERKEETMEEIKTEELKLEEKKEAINPLETEKISKLMKQFAIPCIISLVVSSLYNIVDQIFIGQGVGYLGNAATNIVFPFTVITMAFSLMIGDGASAYLSLSLGKNDKESANKGVANGMILSAIMGIAFLILGWIFQEGLLKLFGVTESSYEYAKVYMTYIVLGMPFFILTNALNSIIRADGSPGYAMATVLVGAILNIILDPIAIFVFHMGVKGAAIATVVGQVVSGILSVLYIRKFKSVHITKENLKLDGKTLKKVCSLGVSSFITQVAITVVLIVINQMLTKYGAESKYGSEIPLSALGIVMKVNQIVNSVVIGLAVGAQPIIGFNFGAQKYDRVLKTYGFAIKIGLIITAIGTLIFQLCPQVIINLFGQENELYNEFAKMCFRIFIALVIFNSFQIISGIFFQAIGNPVKAAILSLSRQIGFLIPALLLLPRFFGIQGILYAGPTADSLAAILAIVLVTIEVKKLKKGEVK